eukprot:25418-Eustigmatos_ZCMA.PRE.1
MALPRRQATRHFVITRQLQPRSGRTRLHDRQHNVDGSGEDVRENHRWRHAQRKQLTARIRQRRPQVHFAPHGEDD